MSRYWLLKSEPSTFSIEDLQNAKQKRTYWEGVRNYQARNFLRAMEKDDLAFFYHSNTKTPGIVGIVKVVETAMPDPTQFDPHSPYFDSRASQEKPYWDQIEVEFVLQFKKNISLHVLKTWDPWQETALVKKGSRLSVIPIPTAAWQQVLQTSI